MRTESELRGMAKQCERAHAFAAALRKYRAGNRYAAARRCREALARAPDDAAARSLLGLICLDQSRFEEAAAHFGGAAAVRPDTAELHFRLGTALIALQRYSEADKALRRALALAPERAAAWNNLGNALVGLGRDDEATVCHQRAVTLQPDYVPALYNLGRAYLRRDRVEEAADLFRVAAGHAVSQREPGRLVQIYDYLFGTLLSLGRDDEAETVCDTLRALGSRSDVADWNESLLLLKHGRFAEGWPKYERRYLAGRVPPHPRAAPLDLAGIAGKRLLVCGEQGHGDVIQFVRYAPLLAERGAEVYLSIYRELQPLVSGMRGVAAVLGPDDPEPSVDLVAALPSMPLAFRTDVGSIPAAVPYLRAPAGRLATWAVRFRPHQRPRIGICWRGSQWSAQHAAMPVMALLPLLRRTDLEFHVVQTDLPAEDREWLRTQTTVTMHTDALADYADTAALIECLDLVITIDTSVAHLAGALGRPVWIMLHFGADWRWMAGRDDSPWYPTARLFRQSVHGDWKTVVGKILPELDTFIARSKLGVNHES